VIQSPPSPYVEWYERHPFVKDVPHATLTRLAETKNIIHVADLRLDPGYLEGVAPMVALVDGAGARTDLLVPMLNEDQLIGAIVIYGTEVRPFTDKQVELVENFAAQAVIAIENARLLNELRQRTTDLTESLAQQTATSEVLRVIARSPADAQPAFEAMVARAARLCEADFSAVARFENGLLHLVARFPSFETGSQSVRSGADGGR
jgi:GAF domain-containing protein